MKKKLSFLTVAFMAIAGVAAFATSTTWKVTSETALDAGSTYISDDALDVKTVYQTTRKSATATYGEESFTSAIQIRVDAWPTTDNLTGTETSGSTPLVITAKKDLNITFYYLRQAGNQEENDGKDLRVFDQANISTSLTGTFTLGESPSDTYYNSTKTVTLEEGHVYTVAAKGTTIQLYGLTYEYEDAKSLEAGVYYIQDASTGRFMTRGQSWGTQAVTEPYGLPWQVSLSKGAYTLHMYDIAKTGNTSGLGSNGYADNGSPMSLTIPASSTNEYVIQNGTTYVVANSTYAITPDATAAGNNWKFLTVDEYKAYVAAYDTLQWAATATSAGVTGNLLETLASDYAAKTISSGFDATPTNSNAWKYTAVRSGAVNYGTYGSEVYQATGYYSQTISGLKQGIYKVGIKAMKREGANANCYTIGQEGYPLSSAYLTANGVNVCCKDWYSSAVSNSNPNSTGDFVTIANDGGYYAETYVYVGSEGTLEVKVSTPAYWGGSWFLFNSIDLIYYSTEVSEEDATALLATVPTDPMNAEVLSALTTAKTAFEAAKTVPNYNALKAAIETANASVAIYAATKTTLDTYATLAAALDTKGQAAYDVTAVQTAYTEGTMVDDQSAVVKAAYIAAVKAQGVGADMTGAVLGAACTSASEIAEWSTNTDANTVVLNTWSTEADASGLKVPFAQAWINSGSVLAAQTIKHSQVTGLKAGTYTISVFARVFNENSTANPAGFYFYANNDTVDMVAKGTSATYNSSTVLYGTYTATATVDKAGTLDFGFVVKGEVGNWLSWKGVTLTYTDYVHQYDTEVVYVKTDLKSIATGEVVAIVDQTSSTAMANDGGTNSAPTATAVTLNEEKTEISGEVASNLQWEVTVAEAGYQFAVPNTTNYLYTTSGNNGVRVGTNTNNVFSWISDSGNQNSTEYFLKNNATSRYIGVNNKTDWRCYTSINSNIKATVTAFYKKTETQVEVAVSRPTISLESGTYVGTQSVEITCPTDGASIYYTTDGTEPTSASTLYEGAISIADTTVLKAIAVLDENSSKVATATYNIAECVANTAATALTVAEAKALIDAKDAAILALDGNQVYVKGIVYKVEGYNATYKSMTYWISADGTNATDTLECYSGKGINGADFADTTDVVAGAEVVVLGNLKKYNTIYEFDKNNQLVTYIAPSKDVTIEAADITNGDLTAAIDSVSAGYAAKNLTINLAADVTYTLTASIAARANVVVNGNGATIDASGLNAPFINYSKVEGDSVFKADTTFSGYLNVDAVTIDNVKISGLANSIINNGAGKVLFDKITVSNSVIEIKGSKAIFALSNGYPTALDITKSTLWSAAGHTGFLFQAQGRPAKDIADNATATFSIDNSTMYQIGVGKKINNNNSGLKGQKCLMLNLTNSILYNFGSSTGNEVNGWLFGQNSTNPTTVYENNTYYSADGVVAGWTDASKAGSDQTGTSLTTDPAFKDAANGDFTIGASTAQAKMQTGDPRWLVDFVAPEGAKKQALVVETETPGDLTQLINTQKYAIINALDTVGDVTISLKAKGSWTVSESIEATGNVTITGVDSAMIDASSLTAPLIAMPSPVPAAFAEANDLAIKNVIVKNLQKALFYSTGKYYAFNNFDIDSCVVEIAGDATTIDFTKGSTALNITVTNSTFYAPTKTTKSFYSSQGGQKATEYASDAVQTFTFKNNTMYNLAPGKNFFSHRQSNQKWLTYDVENNIFVDCGKSGQVIKGFNGGQSGSNPTWIVKGNLFNYGGADTSASESTGDAEEPVQESVVGIVTFTDVTTGDFNGSVLLAPTATQPEALGDGRWTLAYTAGLAINIAECTGGTVTTSPATYTTAGTEVTITATPAENYVLTSITVTDAAGTEVTVTDSKFTMPETAVTVTVVFTTTDGIEAVVADDADNAEIFNLQGVRVNKAQKGIYIVNGKKVLVK